MYAKTIAGLPAIVMLGLLLTGCNPIPVVTYYKIETGANALEHKVSDTYYLAHSQVLIDRTSRQDDKSKKITEEYSIASKPVAFTDYKVGVRPHSSMFVNTKVNIVKIDNSDLVASVGIETTDNVATFISQLGGVITKVVSLAPGVTKPTECIPDENFPLKLVVMPNDLKGSGSTTLSFDGAGAQGAGGCINLTIQAAPKDAVESFPFQQATSDYYYAACRDATITLRQGTKTLSKDIRISDPNRWQFVQLPYKGSITTHSQCGVSVKTEGTSPLNALGIADAIAAQLKAIRDSLDGK
jgi:hypothetical protein